MKGNRKTDTIESGVKYRERQQKNRDAETREKK